MDVILLERVESLGAIGDVVKVKNGFARNYLLPQRLAIEATVSNKAVIVQMKESAVRKAVKDKTAATEQAEKLSAVEVTFERKVGANDVLFGSVTSQDIAAELAKQGYEIDMTSCTGCAVCVEQCPCHAMEMHPEPTGTAVAIDISRLTIDAKEVA